MSSEFFAQVRASLAGRPTPGQLHRVRLAAKKIRYTLELFRPCYGQVLEQRIEDLRNLQNVLGDVNDCAVTRKLLKNIPNPRLRAKADRFLDARMREKISQLRKLWSGGMGAPAEELRWVQYLTRNARSPRREGHELA
jgi:CHAD domain-containing protein